MSLFTDRVEVFTGSTYSPYVMSFIVPVLLSASDVISVGSSNWGAFDGVTATANTSEIEAGSVSSASDEAFLSLAISFAEGQERFGPDIELVIAAKLANYLD